VNDVNDHADQWDRSHDDADEWERSRDHRQLATRSRIRDHSIEQMNCQQPACGGDQH